MRKDISQPEPSQHIQLRGEVIGIFEQEGRRMVRIGLSPHTLFDVGAETIPEAGLGDTVLIAARVMVSGIEPLANENLTRRPGES